ncbi:MAG: DUF4238 domain-containing protein [Lysobacteraceae bacterium]
MASHKNQHFVPRCYLKPFTRDGAGQAINLLNLDRQVLIENAPVKHQCSGNFFYGQDLTIERDLQHIEGAYAASLVDVLREGHPLAERTKDLLRAFWLVQFVRTDAASRRTAEMSNGFAAHTGIPEDYRLSIRQAVQMSMTLLGEVLPFVMDLKVCLFRNRTPVPFVTSDDPAILTNRWHLHDERTRWRSIGLGKAGALFLLPLSPAVMCVCYDGDVYSIPHRNGWARVERAEDVRAFNEHQFLNCLANVYYQDWPGRTYMLEESARLASLRPAQRYRIHLAVLDREQDGYERYRVVQHLSDEAGSKVLIHSESIPMHPTAWPSVIGWRPQGVAYTNRTARGYIRRAQAEALGFGGFHKVRIR